MKPPKTSSKITPYLILCSFAILWSLYGIISIYAYKSEDVVMMPILFILLLAGIVLLLMDRLAIKKWKQKFVVIAELISIPVFLLFMSFGEKRIIIQSAENIPYVGLVYPVEPGNESTTEYAFPFNRKIKINSADQTVFLTESMKEKYKLDIVSNCDVYTSGRRETINNKTYFINIYSLCSEQQDEDQIINGIIKKMAAN